MLLEVRWETKHPSLVFTEILRFLSIFKKCQASSPFETLNSVASRDVKACEAPSPGEGGNYGFIYGLHRGFRYYFICEMRDEPAHKPL